MTTKLTLLLVLAVGLCLGIAAWYINSGLDYIADLAAYYLPSRAEMEVAQVGESIPDSIYAVPPCGELTYIHWDIRGLPRYVADWFAEDGPAEHYHLFKVCLDSIPNLWLRVVSGGDTALAELPMPVTIEIELMEVPND